MPINKPSSDYSESVERVARVVDCYMGQDAVKEKGDDYLPKLGGQTNEDYEAYKKRGYLLPIVKPTVAALTGAIMRKPPVVELPTQLQYLIDDSDGNGRDLSMVANLCLKNLMIKGRQGLLIDPLSQGAGIKLYDQESIINWHPNYIVLQQAYVELDSKDKFTQAVKLEFVELTFDETGQYIQNIWREDKKSYSIVETIEPSINGQRLDYLPFVFINTLEATEALTDPLLLPLADSNIDQYRLSTDLRHGLHWTALPTLFLFGELTDKNGRQITVSVGSGASNNIEDTDARAELIEFTGAGLGAITQAVNDVIVAMSSIGAKLLQDNSGGVQAAETARIEQSSESATLATIASSVENGLKIALTIIADWSNAGEGVEITLNRDFVDTGLDPQQVSTYLQAYLSNAISLNTFLNLLQKNDILPEGITADDEEDRILSGSTFAEPMIDA